MGDRVFSGHQPNFLPYMGFFYKMYRSDVFVLDDDVQYSRQEYQNYNYIKVNGEKFKMTIPVEYKFGDAINQVKISHSKPWERKLLSTIRMNYCKTAYFGDVYEMFQRNLLEHDEYLADLNISMIAEIKERLGIPTKLVIASKDVPTTLKNNDRNVLQCKKLGCNIYYSGQGGKAYNDDTAFTKEGIKIVYTDYVPIKYEQTGKDFIENLSVLDYLFNEGFNRPQGW